MTLPRLILASDDAELERRLAEAVDGLADVLLISPTAGNLLQTLVEAKPTILLVDQESRTPLHIIVGLVRRADPALHAVAIGDARNPDAVLGAVRAGATDFLDKGEPRDVLRAQVLRHLQNGAEASRAAPGSFELVLSAQPGGGESLFALNLAVLRACAGGDMLFVDCSLPTSEAAAALDIRTAYTVQDAVKDIGRLDRTLVTSALARHPDSGLMVLPLATTAAPDVESVAPEALARLVAAVRPLFRDTLLAAGGVRSPGLLLEFMQAAGRIYFLCEQKFTALADGQQLLRRIDPGPEVLGRTVLVVDEHQPSISLTEEQMRTALGLTSSFRLPPSRVELINSLNTGHPLVLEQPRGAYALALAKGAGIDAPASSSPRRLITGAVSKARNRIFARGAR